MNIHKHMEAILILTLAVVWAGSMLIDSMPQADAAPAPFVAQTAPAPHCG